MNNISYIFKRIASVFLWLLVGFALIGCIVFLSEGEFPVLWSILLVLFLLLRIPFSKHMKSLSEQRKVEKARINEAQKLEDSIEFRMRCNVCGHVYCYTVGDLKKNKQLEKDATTASIVGLTQTIGTSAVLGQMYQNEAEQKRSGIIDYSRCPKCHSQDVTEIPEGAPIPPIATDTTPSSMDELRKLKELLDQGIVTQDEFDAKKKQLLGL